MEVINFHSAQTVDSACVVCGTNPLSDYVDLTSVTSRTSQSDTPIRDKVRMIIQEKWPTPARQDLMCHQCFHLVDQFDTLETQLLGVKAQLCDRYYTFHGSSILDQVPYHHRNNVGQQRTKRAVTSKNHRAVAGNMAMGKRKRAVLETREPNLSLQPTHGVCLQVDNRKDKTGAILQWHDTVLQPFEQTAASVVPELTVPSQQLTERETEHIITSLNNAVTEPAWRPAPQPARPSEETAPSEVVYDRLPGILVPGERLRVGTLSQGEDGGLTYRCCYCGDLFSEHVVLSSHVHSHHRPEVLTTQVPAELGLGTKLHCGVRLSNVTVSSEFAKPFVCVFCDSAFKFKSNVHLHFKEKHTPYRPFSCMDCNETFRRSMELSRHRVYYCSFRKKAQTGHDKKSK